MQTQQNLSDLLHQESPIEKSLDKHTSTSQTSNTSSLRKNLEAETTKGRKNITIISTNSSRRSNSTLNAMVKCFNDYSICHMTTPGGGIHQILNNLQDRLRDYTMQDYCVMLIGDRDFQLIEDFDAAALVSEITSTLATIKNTNVIVCTPTYICGAPIYNYRVELFNTYLNRKLKSNDCAHFFDSNLYVTFDMFSYLTGKITNLGIVNILENVTWMLTKIAPKINGTSHCFRASQGAIP